MKRALVGILVLLLQAAMGAPGRAEVKSEDVFMARSEAVAIELEVTCPAKKVRLEVMLEVAAGSVAWELYDPEGRLRADGQAAEGGGIFRTEHLDPARGTWRLRIQFVAATGRYRVNWATQG
jgi:hypothetical protein